MTIYTGYSYRLRAGSPMPIATPGEFVIHSFMAEYHIQDTDTCATRLLASTAFRGQGGGYSAANYSRIVSAGEPVYNASESLNFKYIEEVE
mgnify:CR=1 FL=1